MNVLAKRGNEKMGELLLVLGFAWLSYKWLLPPTQNDMEDCIVMTEFSNDDDLIA